MLPSRQKDTSEKLNIVFYNLFEYIIYQHTSQLQDYLHVVELKMEQEKQEY